MCGASVGISVNKLQLPEQTKTAKGIKNERKKEITSFILFLNMHLVLVVALKQRIWSTNLNSLRILLFFAYPLCPSNLTSVCLPDCLSTADDQSSVMLIIATQ